MRLLYAITIVCLLAACAASPALPTATPVPIQPDAPQHVVAWVESGNLLAWQTGDSFPRRIATSGVIQPFIALDGDAIAFTRGAAGIPETLWVVDTNGVAERQLIGTETDGYTPGIHLIGDVVWQDNGNLLVNTLTAGRPAAQPRHDLYHVTISPRVVRRILADGQGGRLHLSPDRTRAILVRPGSYDGDAGVLALYSRIHPQTPRTLFTFPAVATGSERAFYPSLTWLPDSTALLVALPDRDLVYAENDASLPPTAIWQIPLDDGQPQRIGSVQASFFGQPIWSDDGAYLLYLQREAQSNRFTLYEAAADGSAVRAVSGSSGQISPPAWIPATQDYVFARVDDDAVTYFIGGVGLDPVRFSPDPMLLLRFISPTDYVYAAQGDGRIELWLASRDGGSQFIGSAARLPLLNAWASSAP